MLALDGLRDLLRRVRWANLGSVVVVAVSLLILATGWRGGGEPEAGAERAAVEALSHPAAPAPVGAAGREPATEPGSAGAGDGTRRERPGAVRRPSLGRGPSLPAEHPAGNDRRRGAATGRTRARDRRARRRRRGREARGGRDTRRREGRSAGRRSARRGEAVSARPPAVPRAERTGRGSRPGAARAGGSPAPACPRPARRPPGRRPPVSPPRGPGEFDVGSPRPSRARPGRSSGRTGRRARSRALGLDVLELRVDPVARIA